MDRSRRWRKFRLYLLACPPARGRRGRAFFVLSFMVVLFTVIGCGGTAQTTLEPPKVLTPLWSQPQGAAGRRKSRPA